MGKFVNDTLIVVPIFVKEHDQDLVDKIRELANVGTVYVVNQGKRLDFGETPKQKGKFDQIEVFHMLKPAGIWGALEEAFKQIVVYSGGGVHDHMFFQQSPDYVILNLAPKLFDAKICERIMVPTSLVRCHHIVGVRNDIAASLGSKQRAYLECFFSTLAGIVLGNSQAFSRDGFTGLHLLSFERYAASDWAWVEAQKGQQPWGGALITQIQSFQMNALICEVQIDTRDAQRTWPSTLGDDERKAVFAMLDKCRKLPIFTSVAKKDIQSAFEQFGYDFVHQGFLNDKNVQDLIKEIQILFNDYNKQSPLGPFLAI